MLSDFLNRYFGKDPFNHKLALFLIKNKETEAAKELNRAICQFGDKLRPYQLEKKIIEKYQIDTSQIDENNNENKDSLNGGDIDLFITLLIIIFAGIFLGISQ